MAKDIFLYTELRRWMSEWINESIVSANVNADLNMHYNGPGGDVIGGIAVISKVNSFKQKGTGKVNMYVDGVADSLYAFMLVFSDYSEASDMSTMTFHKAAFEESYSPTESEAIEVKKLNDSVQAKMQLRIQGKGAEAQAFVDMIFEENVRNERTLTAQEAKDFGIIDAVNVIDVKVTAKKARESAMQMLNIEKPKETPKASNTDTNSNSNKPLNEIMDLAKFKADHPAVYAQVYTEGETAGIKTGTDLEHERAKTILAYKDAGIDYCIAMIVSREAITASKQAELGMKVMQGKTLDALGKEGDAIPPVTTAPASPAVDQGAQTEAEKAEIKAYQEKKFTS